MSRNFYWQFTNMFVCIR